MQCSVPSAELLAPEGVYRVGSWKQQPRQKADNRTDGAKRKKRLKVDELEKVPSRKDNKQKSGRLNANTIETGSGKVVKA